MSDILPCPFCDSHTPPEMEEVETNGVTTAIYIICDCCEARGPSSSIKETALGTWNQISKLVHAQR